MAAEIEISTLDLNIQKIEPLPTPTELINTYQPNEEDQKFVTQCRETVRNILVGTDPRLLVVVGPCSIHDVQIAIEYSKYISQWQEEFPNLFLVMRVYFEKPRSRLGWKGFIYDPNLDESFDINKGLTQARQLLLNLTKSRIPIGCEFLDTLTPQYLSDMVCWGAIGARTSESQVHRQLSSGLSMPVGFKNPTNGDYKKAIDGIISARFPHHFLSLNYNGQASCVRTLGNKSCHLILRGGTSPNYYQSDLEEITSELKKDQIETGIVIDCSHGNSQKYFKKQILVALSIRRLRLDEKYPIRGVMLESNLEEGNQPLKQPLKHGVSITDGCLGIRSTHMVLYELNAKPEKTFRDLPDIRSYIKELENYLPTTNKTTTTTANENGHANANGDATTTVTKHQPPPRPFDYSGIAVNVDDEIYSLFNYDDRIMWFVHTRVSLGEMIAKFKFESDPFHFMLKDNDFYTLITDRTVEIDIVKRTQETIFMGIIELTKKAQSEFLELYTSRKKIGYLGKKGTFSYEAVTKFFRGQHTGFDTVDEAVKAYLNKQVDYLLLPTYNSIVGSISLTTEALPAVKGKVEHPIHLATLGNSQFNPTEAEVLYVQHVVYKEAENYLKKFKKAMEVVIVKSTEQGCKSCIVDSRKAITIASVNNVCPFLHLLEGNIVQHNVTSFSLY